jgi:membrane fusion protein, multidrug efflux system
MTDNSRFQSGRTYILLGAVVLVAAGLALMFRPSGAKPAAAPPPAAVSVAQVAQKAITEWDEFSGRVEAVERVEIRPRVSGTIDRIHFDEGQLVRKGDLLFTIDPRPYQAALAQAQATQAGAQARMVLAKTEVERARRLIDQHAIAQTELDTREGATLEANAALLAAQAAVQTARLNLQYTAITAPVAGRVSRAEITVGNLVGPGGSGPPLTSVVSVTPVYVNFDVDEPTFIRYAAAGAAGNTGIKDLEVAIGLATETGYPHSGHIKAFDNRLDTVSGTIRVRAVIDNASGMLTPGLFARVRTSSGKADVALLIDDKAVGTDQNKSYVMLLGAGNKVSYRRIQLGPVVDGARVVRSGLASNDRIVVDGLQRIHPNDTVTPTVVPMFAPPQASPAY